MSVRDNNVLRPVWPYQINHTSHQAVGLVAWWPMALGGGNTAFDLVAGAHARVASGSAPAWSFSNPAGLPAVACSGTTDMQATHKSTLDLQFPFTIALWIRYTTTSNLVIIEKNGNSGFSIQNSSPSPGKLQINVGGASAPNWTITANTWNDGNWHQVIFVANGTSGNKVYVDGRDDTGTSAATGSPSYGSSTPVMIGSRGGSFGTVADLTDIRFYNRSLSQAEAQALYDPQTRYELYWQPWREWNRKVPSVAHTGNALCAGRSRLDGAPQIAASANSAMQGRGRSQGLPALSMVSQLRIAGQARTVANPALLASPQASVGSRGQAKAAPTLALTVQADAKGRARAIGDGALNGQVTANVRLAGRSNLTATAALLVRAFGRVDGRSIAAVNLPICTIEPFPKRLAEFAQAALARARSINVGLMPETVTVKRGALANDGYGQTTRSYAPQFSTKARVRRYNERLDGPLGGGIEEASIWVFTLPFGTDVTDMDQIERDGVAYEVVGIEQRASYSSSVTVYAREL